jgi:hypothetical protein
MKRRTRVFGGEIESWVKKKNGRQSCLYRQQLAYLRYGTYMVRLRVMYTYNHVQTNAEWVWRVFRYDPVQSTSTSSRVVLELYVLSSSIGCVRVHSYVVVSGVWRETGNVYSASK